MSSLKDRLAQDEKANTELQGDLKVVTSKLKITQGQLKKAREEAAKLNDATTQKVADEYGVPLLGQLPLDPDTRKGGDEGAPIIVRRPDSPQAAAFRDIARRVIERLEATATLRPLPTIS